MSRIIEFSTDYGPLNPFPHTIVTAADDFENILAKTQKMSINVGIIT